MKRPFFLFEILIGLSLMAIVLSFLFTAMARSMKWKAKMEAARSSLLERQHLQVRLQDLFLSVQSDCFPSLYTKRFPHEKQESLIAIFHNGIDPDPAYSGPVLGRVFLDEENNLSLALWPIEKGEKKHPWRKEILLSQVDDFTFQFLGKSGRLGSGVNAQFSWHDCWLQKRLEMPSMVRLSLTQNGTSLSFAFFFPGSEPLVTYWEEGYRS